MRSDWRKRLDWRLVAGASSVVAIVAGLSWYAGYREAVPLTSRWVAGIVASAALVAILLTVSRSLWNLVGYVALVALFGAMFVRSQLRRGAFAPPLEEWTIAVGLVGGLIAIVLLLRRSRSSHDAGPPTARGVGASALAILAVGAACLCIPIAKLIGDDAPESDLPSRMLHSTPTIAELAPLPADTEVTLSESFSVGGEGQHVFVFASTIGAERSALVTLLVTHYTNQDWPLAREQVGRRKVWLGCRPVRGLITWKQHCLEVTIDEGTDDRPGYPTRPGTVNVYIQ